MIRYVIKRDRNKNEYYRGEQFEKWTDRLDNAVIYNFNDLQEKKNAEKLVENENCFGKFDCKIVPIIMLDLEEEFDKSFKELMEELLKRMNK